MMKAVKLLAIAGTFIMFVALVYGFVAGDFFKEGSVLMSLAWGRVSLIDVYIGFFLFSGWVVYREKNWLISALWILLIMILGNFITCLYVTSKLFQSGDDIKRFWLGKHAHVMF
jgi:hypothetical protein